MSKKRKKVGVQPFVPLRWDLLNSPAYRELKPSTAKALPFFLGKEWSAKREENNPAGAFAFSYKEAERLGFAKRTFSDVVTDLVAKGLIDVAGYGGLRGFCNVGSKYKLSERWRHFGQPTFESVPRYPSEEPPTMPVRARAKAKRASPKPVVHG